MSRRRRIVRIVVLAVGIPFLAVIGVLALAPRRVEQSIPNVLDLTLDLAHRLGWSSLDFATLEVVANVLVFIPLGIVAYVFLPRRLRWLALLIGPAVSLAIEVTQLLALPNRDPSLHDVIANSIGATIGVVICALCSWIFMSRASQHPSPTLEAK